jgi:CO dehydrogenase/acetyl-CoA synthase gamma subunit (corrinoid Fe-S protein)
LHCVAHLDQDISNVLPKPNIPEILKWLPKTNCHKCNPPTCLVFAVRLAEGLQRPADCPELSVPGRQKLAGYLNGFQFEN